MTRLAQLQTVALAPWKGDDALTELRRLTMTHYHATINVPGYLPMADELVTFDTPAEAWQYLVSEVERSWDEYPEDENGASIDAHTQMHNVNQAETGTIYAPTPGYDGEHDLGLAYSVTLCDNPDCDAEDA